MNNSIIVSEYSNRISRPVTRHMLLVVLVSVLSVFVAYQLRWPLVVEPANAEESNLGGFYNVEGEGEHKFRWTNGNGEIIFPDVGQATQVRLNIRARAWRTETYVFSATVTVNGQTVGIIDKAGWRNWSMAVSDPTVLRADRLVVGIKSTPFRFDELYPDLEDDRELGISIESVQIELQPAANSNFLSLITVPATKQIIFGILLVVATYLFSCFLGAHPRTAFYHSLGAMVGFAILIAFFGLAASQHILILAGVAGFIALSRVLAVWPKGVAVVLIPFFLIALLANAYLGFFARYSVDDFCIAGLVNVQGMLDYLQYALSGINGRYSLLFVLGIAGLVGPQLVPLLPLSALTIWIAVTVWAIFQLRRVANRGSSIAVPFLFAAMVIFGTIDGTPNVAESLLWQTGMLAYLAPLPFFTFVIGLICYVATRQSESSSLVLLIICASLTLFAAGFQETYAALQTTALFLAVVLCLVMLSTPKKRTVLSLLIAGLMGSVLAMAIMILSPGNANRQAFAIQQGLIPQPLGWISVIELSMQYAAVFVKDSIIGSSIMLVLFLLAALVALVVPSERLETANHRVLLNAAMLLTLVPILGFLMVVACFAPGAYVFSSSPPDRAFVVPQYVVVCVVTLEGYLLGLVEKHVGFLHSAGKFSYSILLLILVILVIWGPISFSRKTLDQAPRWRTFAEMWDKRDLEIRSAKQAGLRNLQVLPFYNPFGQPDIGPDPDNWINRCTAAYYGVDSIIIR